MARLDDLKAALIAADKAGDTVSAQLLADEIRNTEGGKPTGLSRPLPVNSWLFTGKDPALTSANAALIAAGRESSKIKEGVRQPFLSDQEAKVQAAQEKENDRLYAPLQKEFPVATAAGGAAPALAIPMGGPTAVARVAIPALGMAGLEASKYGTPQERAARGVAGLASGLTGGLTTEAIARAIMPLAGAAGGAQQRTVKELIENVGAKPLPSQLANSPSLARYEDMLARAPGSAGVMSNFMDENRKAVQSTAARGMGETANTLDASVLGGAKARIGANFNALRQNATMPSSQPVFDAIDNAQKLLSSGNKNAGGKKEASETLNALKDELFQTKQFSGDQYKSWVSDLRTQARETQNETVRAALKQVTRAMDDEARLNTAPTVDAQGNPVTWGEADKQWAMLKALLKPNVTNDVTGELNPAAFARGVGQDMKGGEKLGKLTGETKALYEYGKGVPQLRAGSPTFERGEADSLVGMLKAVPRYVAAQALTSPATVPYLTRGLLGNPQASEALALLAGRGAFPATAGLLDAQLLALLTTPVAAK